MILTNFCHYYQSNWHHSSRIQPLKHNTVYTWHSQSNMALMENKYFEESVPICSNCLHQSQLWSEVIQA